MKLSHWLAWIWLTSLALSHQGHDHNEDPDHDHHHEHDHDHNDNPEHDHAADWEGNPNIVNLTDETFEAFIGEANETGILVVFYAPWCGHCKALMPEFNKAGDILKETNSPIRLAKINATENQNTSQKYKIEGFPTIYLFLKGQTIEYIGERTHENIIAFCERKLQGPYRKFDSVQEITQLSKKSNLILVSTLQPDKTEELKLFEEFGANSHEIEYVHCPSKDCVDTYKSEIVFIRSFDEPIVPFPHAAITEETLTKFIDIYGIELGGPFNDYAVEAIFNWKKTCLFYFRDNNDKWQLEKDAIIKSIALKHREEMYFFVWDVTSTSLFEQVGDFYKVDSGDYPAIKISMIKSDDDILNYNMPLNHGVQGVTPESIESFINDFKEGKLEKELNTQGRPVQDKHFHIIVGKTFQADVIDNHKKVVLLVTHVECESCELLEEIWDVLGDKYNENDDILIAKIDLTENEVRGWVFENYPVILGYFSEDKSEKEMYSGDTKIIKIEEWFADKMGWNNVKSGVEKGKTEGKEKEKIEEL